MNLGNRRRIGIGAFGIALAAIGLLGTSAVIGMTMRTAGPRDQVSVHANGMVIPALRSTMDAAHWLGDRGILKGIKLADSAASESSGERLRVHLVPAAGVTIPSGTFEAKAIRFNEAGEVVEIVPAESAGCSVVVVYDPDFPEDNWIGCVGGCKNASLHCTLSIDLSTLEIACPCM